jgi:ubiquinone/menaquinone biosynthesis C-methylase UbiE
MVMIWVLGAVGLTVLGCFLYWTIVVTEGSYFGQGVVTYLYDRAAHKYNKLKEYNEADEYCFLSVPLRDALGYNFHGTILDVAVGTGRLPVAMAALPDFSGRVIGLDHSAGMLAVARQHLPTLPLIQADAMRLPFAANSFEAVTCLEALEFVSEPKTGLQELIRILMPGGILLTTNRVGWETKLMPGKTWSSDQLHAILAAQPLDDFVVIPWETIYDQIWARKRMW